MVAVMLMGGRKDGQVMEVPGELAPRDRYLTFAVPRITKFEKESEYGQEVEDIQRVKAFITPRQADSGPAWKVEVPREAWNG